MQSRRSSWLSLLPGARAVATRRGRAIDDILAVRSAGRPLGVEGDDRRQADGPRRRCRVRVEPGLRPAAREFSREKNKAGSPEYEAIVFISRDKTSGDFSCLWLDNTSAAGLSASGIAHAKPTDTSLPFIFNIGKDHVFRTTFIYSAKADTWEWRMDDDTNGKLAPFARVTLSRRH